MECKIISIDDIVSECEETVHGTEQEYTINDGFVYCNGILIGIVKRIEGNEITVEHIDEDPT